MKNNVLDIKSFTNQELLREMERRMLPPLKLPELPKAPLKPYDIMLNMIENDWKENPATGKSDPRITNMWRYLGFGEFTDDESYCAATVNACLTLAGYETSQPIPVARSFDSYGESVLSNKVVAGDIVVFARTDSDWKGHVGFVVSVEDDGSIAVAGGNQNDRMCIKTYHTLGTNLTLKSFRRITDKNLLGKPDFNTLKDWGLV